ncbi:MAG: hypothetical protein HYZ28_15170 [Myxococcales bacterium]|nr:hypothetical protein [Myxococcales bacterium]
MEDLKRPHDVWLSAPALAIAAILLGYALQLTNGTLHPTAIGCLIGSIALAVLALASIRVAVIERRNDRLAVAILGAGLAYQFGVHLTTAPGVYLRHGADFVTHHYYVVAAAVLLGAALSPRPWLGRAAIPLMLLGHFLLGLWLLEASPSPFIDVHVWHREAFSALGRWTNPYSVNMPNIYGHTHWYAPGIADATTVKVGYPYPPLSLLLAAPGHLLAGDYRYANLVALTASGALMAYARPGRLSTAAAAIFLFTPRGLFVLEQGWTEANAILMLAVAIFLACRAPRALPYGLGLLLAVKQYFVLIAPLMLLIAPAARRELLRFSLKAVILALAVTLPLALWDVGGFVSSVVTFQGKQPFRPDALSFVAWTAREGIPVLPGWVSFAAVVPVLGFAFWRAPRSPFGFAAASALLYLLFFGFAKQAFANYYFLVIGALCCAIAALHPTDAAPQSPDTRSDQPSERPLREA